MTIEKILTAHLCARFISERMHAAHWAEASREFLLGDLANDLRKLADAMGYDIVERAQLAVEAEKTEGG